MNVGEIKTAIQALGYGTDTAAVQLIGIQDTHRRVHGLRRWPWMDSSAVNGTVAANSELVVFNAADALHIDSARLVSTTLGHRDLSYVEPEELDRLLHEDRDSAVPQLWSARRTTLKVYPRATAACEIDVNYAKSPALLTVDTDVPPMPETYHDIYVWGGASFVAARERDWAARQVYSEQLSSRIGEMQAALGVRQRQSPTNVRRVDWWKDF